jgi:hypothetical protein
MKRAIEPAALFTSAFTISLALSGKWDVLAVWGATFALGFAVGVVWWFFHHRRPGLRFRLAWANVKDGFAEWFRWSDHGAARTNWGIAWNALWAPRGQFPGERKS